MQPKFDKNKENLKSLANILDTIKWLKKPSHATVPLTVAYLGLTWMGWNYTWTALDELVLSDPDGSSWPHSTAIITQGICERVELFNFLNLPHLAQLCQ
jgi:hypothetical protein